MPTPRSILLDAYIVGHITAIRYPPMGTVIHIARWFLDHDDVRQPRLFSPAFLTRTIHVQYPPCSTKGNIMSNKYITPPYALLADLEPIDLSKIDLSKVDLPKSLDEIDVRRLPLQDRVPVVCFHQNYGGAQVWQVFPHHWVDELGVCKAEWKDILDAMDLLDPEARRVPFPCNTVEEARALYAKVLDFDNPNNIEFIKRHSLVRPADDIAADLDIDAATQRGLEDAAKARAEKQSA